MTYLIQTSDQGLSAKATWLQTCDAYPEGTDSVTAIETHMSWVFLTDTHAYKLKKPIKLDYLDFSTQDKREHFCREELRLNQQLAPGVYEDVVALRQTNSGDFSLTSEGHIIDWLVRMRRLSRELMLDHLLRSSCVPHSAMNQLGNILTDFYCDGTTAELAGDEYCHRWKAMLMQNSKLLFAPAFELPFGLIESTHARLLEFLATHAVDLRSRARNVVEGHGDLRPEHICLESRPIIFDRLEFNRDFRMVDPVDELSFLAMECEKLGDTVSGVIPLQVYSNRNGDHPSSCLVHFYQAGRACIRARLAAFHIHDCAPSTWPHWRSEAEDYLHIAARHTELLHDPIAIDAHCSSKSTIEPSS